MSNGVMFPKNRALAAVMVALAALIVGLAVAGGVRTYSPVPFWDMWGGYLGFFMQVTDGEIRSWWDQHNEHRIVLARILFWVDLKWFGGASWFLIVVNYLLICASALVFFRAMLDVNGQRKIDERQLVLGLFLISWLFLWAQQENLTWGFQSQFILAQLLPLCALYWLYMSVVRIDRERYFLVACAFGLASVGTMANGVIALPLMTFYALITRQSFQRVGVLTILSVSTIFLYFYDYNEPAHHGSLTLALKENPSGLLQYVLLYVGSPFYFLLGEKEFGKTVGLLTGLFLISASAWFAIKTLRRPKAFELQLALLFFVLYIGGTALGTAGGRLIFGVDQALSSRYVTPALMAWAALLILFSPAALAKDGLTRKKIWIPIVAIVILIIAFQFKALQSRDGELFERSIAALALELRINDQRQIGHVYPLADAALAIAEQPSARNLSIFGMYPYKDVREKFGTSVQQSGLPVCKGSLDGIETIDGDVRFVRVYGWMFNPDSKSYPRALRFLDGNGKMVGYAITGHPRPDVANAIDKKALQSGYRGYLLSSQIGVGLTLQGEYPSGPICSMQASVPLIPFSLLR